RECVRKRRAIEQRQGRDLVAAGVDGTARPDGAIALAREDLRAGTMHLHLDCAKLAVELCVLRRIREQVVELVVLVDAAKRRREIVRLLDEEPAGIFGEPRKTG